MARRAVSKEERALWRSVMHGVKPLPGTPPLPREEAVPAPAAGSAAPAAETPVLKRRKPAAPLPPLAAAATPGIDRRTAERLRRGDLAIAARLDLHGLTQAEAHGVLERFLAEAEARGSRCILVITGKGYRRGDGPGEGILRRAVPRWLNEAPNRARVLAYAPAAPRDGGGGALYVLLKRRR